MCYYTLSNQNSEQPADTLPGDAGWKPNPIKKHMSELMKGDSVLLDLFKG